MTPRQQAIDILNKMNRKDITLYEWSTANRYEKDELKFKAMVCCYECGKVAFKCGDSEAVDYWQQVEFEIQHL